MLDCYLPFRTSIEKGKAFAKLIKRHNTTQSWLLRYLFDRALENLDVKHLKQAIKNDPLSQPKPKKGAVKKDDELIDTDE